jgi:hypothetical protein
VSAPAPDAQTGDLDWLLDGPWATLALLIAVALVVLFVAKLASERSRSSKSKRSMPDLDLRVAKLEALPVSPIVSATAGPVHIEGTICDAAGGLGRLLYRNRYKGRRATAIAVERLILRDASGLVGLEDLEGARVIAPKETAGAHDVVSLYMGDRVQVLGDLERFDQPAPIGEHGDLLVGMLGTLGPIQIRVLEREPASPAAPRPAASAEHESTSPSEPPDHETAPT